MGRFEGFKLGETRNSLTRSVYLSKPINYSMGANFSPKGTTLYDMGEGFDYRKIDGDVVGIDEHTLIRLFQVGFVKEDAGDGELEGRDVARAEDAEVGEITNAKDE